MTDTIPHHSLYRQQKRKYIKNGKENLFFDEKKEKTYVLTTETDVIYWLRNIDFTLFFFLHFVQLKNVQVDPEASFSVGFDNMVSNVNIITIHATINILLLFILVV